MPAAEQLETRSPVQTGKAVVKADNQAGDGQTERRYRAETVLPARATTYNSAILDWTQRTDANISHP